MLCSSIPLRIEVVYFRLFWWGICARSIVELLLWKFLKQPEKLYGKLISLCSILPTLLQFLSWNYCSASLMSQFDHGQGYDKLIYMSSVPRHYFCYFHLAVCLEIFPVHLSRLFFISCRYYEGQLTHFTEAEFDENEEQNIRVTEAAEKVVF